MNSERQSKCAYKREHLNSRKQPNACTQHQTKSFQFWLRRYQRREITLWKDLEEFSRSAVEVRGSSSQRRSGVVCSCCQHTVLCQVEIARCEADDREEHKNAESDARGDETEVPKQAATPEMHSQTDHSNDDHPNGL